MLGRGVREGNIYLQWVQYLNILFYLRKGTKSFKFKNRSKCRCLYSPSLSSVAKMKSVAKWNKKFSLHTCTHVYVIALYTGTWSHTHTYMYMPHVHV